MVEESSKNKARTLRVQLRFPDSAEGENSADPGVFV